MTNTKQLKSIIISSLKSLEDSFTELEKTNKLQLETAEKVFVNRLESIVDMRLIETLQATLGQLNSRIQTLNELKLLNEGMVYNLNSSMAELSFKLDRLAREQQQQPSNPQR